MTEVKQQSAGKRILVEEGLFTVPSKPSEKPKLFASKCRICGEIVFPRSRLCPNCCKESTEEILVGPMGSLYSFTNVNNRGPGGYEGPVPYGIGKVQLDEGVIVRALLTEHNPAKIKAGMRMELVVEKLFEDKEGNEVVGFKFKPV